MKIITFIFALFFSLTSFADYEGGGGQTGGGGAGGSWDDNGSGALCTYDIVYETKNYPGHYFKNKYDACSYALIKDKHYDWNFLGITISSGKEYCSYSNEFYSKINAYQLKEVSNNIVCNTPEKVPLISPLTIDNPNYFYFLGDKGDQGEKGEKGDKGDQGEKGEKGDKGDQGDQGIQGIQGQKGEKGDQGERGLRGIQGIQGEKGEKGEQGERGLRGIQGIQGEKGDQGIQGIQGLAGTDGRDGIDGRDGKDGAIAQFPVFCTWASKVCDFIDEFNKEPPLEAGPSDEYKPDVEDTDKFDNVDIAESYIDADGQCPPAESINIMFGTIDISYEPLCIMLGKLSGIIVAVAYISGGLLIIRTV